MEVEGIEAAGNFLPSCRETVTCNNVRNVIEPDGSKSLGVLTASTLGNDLGIVTRSRHPSYDAGKRVGAAQAGRRL